MAKRTIPETTEGIGESTQVCEGCQDCSCKEKQGKRLPEGELKEALLAFRYLFLTLGFYRTDFNYQEKSGMGILTDGGSRAKEALERLRPLRDKYFDKSGDFHGEFTGE